VCLYIVKKQFSGKGFQFIWIPDLVGVNKIGDFQVNRGSFILVLKPLLDDVIIRFIECTDDVTNSWEQHEASLDAR